MKILAVERTWNEWSLSPEATDGYAIPSPLPMPVSIATDSALVRPGMPMFLPDFTRGWQLHIYPYIVTDHLGKSIPARFAHRYYKGIGLAARLLPPAESGSRRSFLNALTSNFDGAIAPGIPDVPAYDPGDAPTLTIRANGGEPLTLDHATLHADESIALISRYMTLKTGDMILLCDTGITVPAEPDTTLDATLNGIPVLQVRMK